MTDEEAGALVTAARAAARTAWAPYSRFPVGAAVLLADGAVMTGANVENASYGLSLCAETVAVAGAAAAGRMGDVVAVAVAGGGGRPLTPCGRCRQVLAEAATAGGRDVEVVCATADGDTVERHRLSTLLPHAFDARALDPEERRREPALWRSAPPPPAAQAALLSFRCFSSFFSTMSRFMRER